MVSANEIYAVGDSGNTNRAYYRYDGSTWREIARTSFNGSYQQHPWVDPNGGAVYVGSSPNQAMRIDKVTSSGTSVVSYAPALRGVSMPGTTTRIRRRRQLSPRTMERVTLDSRCAPSRHTDESDAGGRLVRWREQRVGRRTVLGHRALGRYAMERGERCAKASGIAGGQLQRCLECGRQCVDRRRRVDHSMQAVVAGRGRGDLVRCRWRRGSRPLLRNLGDVGDERVRRRREWPDRPFRRNLMERDDQSDDRTTRRRGGNGPE